MCRLLIAAFALGWSAATLVWLTGRNGWFGAERDPLSGVFLVPLGWPWNRLVDLAPEPAWPWLAALAPALNLGLLILFCRLARCAPRPGRAR